MSKRIGGNGLTGKQRRFVDEYLIDLNATRAAIAAGYKEKTAPAMGAENLKKPYLAAEIARAMDERSSRTKITQDRILLELAKIGFSDLRKAMSDGGGLLPPCEWDDETAGAISSLEVVTTRSSDTDENGNAIPEHVHKIKTWDKLAALEKLGKHLGMFSGVAPDDDEAQSLNISLNVSKPIKDIRVTRSDA